MKDNEKIVKMIEATIFNFDITKRDYCKMINVQYPSLAKYLSYEIDVPARFFEKIQLKYDESLNANVEPTLNIDIEENVLKMEIFRKTKKISSLPALRMLDAMLNGYLQTLVSAKRVDSNK